MSAPRFVSVRVTIIGIDLIKSNSILWGKNFYVLLNKSLLDTWMDPQVGDASGFLVFASSHNWTAQNAHNLKIETFLVQKLTWKTLIATRVWVAPNCNSISKHRIQPHNYHSSLHFKRSSKKKKKKKT